jgi:choline dehydrogenase-like flavoprotein
MTDQYDVITIGTGAGRGTLAYKLATGPDGATIEAGLQTGESYAFTAAASIRAVEETLARSLPGAFSPAAASGAGFALTIPAEVLSARRL